MSAAREQVQGMTLGARGAEFQRVVAATEVTDQAGRRSDTEAVMVATVGLLKGLRSAGGRLYLVGNGGSAGVASHAITDFLNVAKLRAMTLHEPALLTCMSNDFGYEVAFARILAMIPGSMCIRRSTSRFELYLPRVKRRLP